MNNKLKMLNSLKVIIEQEANKSGLNIIKQLIELEETKPSSPELIEQERRETKDILIELSDEVLKLISEKELDEINESAEEFDGFTGMRVVGRLEKLVNETLAETVYEIRNNIGHSWYSVGQQIPDLKVAKRILNEWRENGDDSFALFKVTKEKMDC